MECYYFNECNSTNTTYCNLCDKWFCPEHKTHYFKRFTDYIKEEFSNNQSMHDY